MPTKPKLRSLVEGAKRGDRKDFEPLLQLYWRAAYGLAYTKLGNKEDAEEVLQETFLKCWLHLDQLRDEEKFGEWLFQILRNECRRAQNRHRELPLPESEKIKTKSNQGETQSQEQIRQELAAMTDYSRELLALRYEAGWRINDIAEHFACSNHKIWNDLRSARETLKRKLSTQKD